MSRPVLMLLLQDSDILSQGRKLDKLRVINFPSTQNSSAWRFNGLRIKPSNRSPPWATPPAQNDGFRIVSER